MLKYIEVVTKSMFKVHSKSQHEDMLTGNGRIVGLVNTCFVFRSIFLHPHVSLYCWRLIKMHKRITCPANNEYIQSTRACARTHQSPGWREGLPSTSMPIFHSTVSDCVHYSKATNGEQFVYVWVRVCVCANVCVFLIPSYVGGVCVRAQFGPEGEWVVVDIISAVPGSSIN